jgi:hypothetical protein
MQFITSTKCTLLVTYDVKHVALTCFGTSVPSSGSTICQVENQLPVISYNLQHSTVCSRLRCWCDLCIKGTTCTVLKNLWLKYDWNIPYIINTFMSNSTIAKSLGALLREKNKPKRRKSRCATAATAEVKPEKAPAFGQETMSPHYGWYPHDSHRHHQCLLFEEETTPERCYFMKSQLIALSAGMIFTITSARRSVERRLQREAASVWTCLKPCCQGAVGLPVPSTYEVCLKSIRPWAGKKMFCIWVVTIPNPLQSRPLVTPHT